MDKIANGSGTMWGILAKYGLATFFAITFFGVIVVYQLQPASQAQEALARDRIQLLDAVTKSLDLNAESMERMSAAVEQLNSTMTRMEIVESKTLDTLSEFTEDATECHKKQIEKLDKIDKQTTPNP